MFSVQGDPYDPVLAESTNYEVSAWPVFQSCCAQLCDPGRLPHSIGVQCPHL